MASQECALQMWTLASLERDMMGDNKRWESGSPPCTYVHKQDYAYGTNETRNLSKMIFVPVRAGAQCVFDGGTRTGCCSPRLLVYPPPFSPTESEIHIIKTNTCESALTILQILIKALILQMFCLHMKYVFVHLSDNYYECICLCVTKI